ncbi:hypothetical protein B0H11DRAFT_1936721 [Mycena galericulata]|nr:hypothetical protein B0H11DRAFT_1936721 [Mycena galericulata]
MRIKCNFVHESPAGTAQKRMHQQDSDALGNSQRSPFASPTLKRPRQINIDGEFVTTSIMGRRSFGALRGAQPVVGNTNYFTYLPVSPDKTTPSFAAIPRPKTFVFHDVSVAHPIICGGCENTIVGVGCGKVMSTDRSAHRAVFLVQGFNMEMICIVSRGTEEDVQRVLHELLLDEG